MVWLGSLDAVRKTRKQAVGDIDRVVLNVIANIWSLKSLWVEMS